MDVMWFKLYDVRVFFLAEKSSLWRARFFAPTTARGGVTGRPLPNRRCFFVVDSLMCGNIAIPITCLLRMRRFAARQQCATCNSVDAKQRSVSFHDPHFASP